MLAKERSCLKGRDISRLGRAGALAEAARQTSLGRHCESIEEGNCAACMDHLLAADIAQVPCDHFYCVDCLQSELHKVLSALKFTC